MSTSDNVIWANSSWSGPSDDSSHHTFSSTPPQGWVGGYTSTSCGGCGYSPCVCTVSWPPSTTGHIEIPDPIPAELRVCVVCGDDEDVVVLCDLCKEAVKLARNKWLEDFKREIEEQIAS